MLLLLFLVVNVVASQDAHNNHKQLWVKTSGQQNNQIQFKRISDLHVVECLAKDSEDIDVCLHRNDLDIKAVTKANANVTPTKTHTEQCQCRIEYSLGCDVAIFAREGEAASDGLYTLDITQRKFVKTIDIKVPSCDWRAVDSKSCHMICYYEDEKVKKVDMYCLKTGTFLFKIFEPSSKVYIAHYDRNTKHLYYFIQKRTWQMVAFNFKKLKHSVVEENFGFVGNSLQISGEEESRMIVWCTHKTVDNYEFNYVIYNMSEIVKQRHFTQIFNIRVHSFAIVNGSMFIVSEKGIHSVPDLATGGTRVLKKCEKDEKYFENYGSYGLFLYMTCSDFDENGHFYVLGANGSTVVSIPDHIDWDESFVG